MLFTTLIKEEFLLSLKKGLIDDYFSSLLNNYNRKVDDDVIIYVFLFRNSLIDFTKSSIFIAIRDKREKLKIGIKKAVNIKKNGNKFLNTKRNKFILVKISHYYLINYAADVIKNIIKAINRNIEKKKVKKIIKRIGVNLINN